MTIQLRVLDRRELPGFRPYLLPDALSLLEAGDGQIMALGAASGRSALGAIAAQLEEDGAELISLFVDAQARRLGVGGALLDGLLARLRELGAKAVAAGYVLQGEDLAAMDALLTGRGFAPPSVRSQVFSARSADFKDDKHLGAAFTPCYRTPERIVPFSALPPAALAELEADPAIPGNLSWSALKKQAQPELSVACLRDGKASAYLLGGDSADGGAILLAAFRREGASPAAFLPLLREQLNRCYYRFGGDFPYHFSALTPRVEELTLRLLGDRFTRREEHTALFRFPWGKPDSPNL